MEEQNSFNDIHRKKIRPIVFIGFIFLVTLLTMIIFAPAFIYLFQIYDNLSLSNWRTILSICSFLDLVSGVLVVTLPIYVILKNVVKEIPNMKPKQKTSFIVSALFGLVFILYFGYLSISSFVEGVKDLQVGVTSYSGKCLLEYYDNTEMHGSFIKDYNLIINNGETKIRTSKSLWNDLGGDIKAIHPNSKECNKNININYLRYSKLQIIYNK